NNAENQLAFIRFLRWIADGEITAEEAVRGYHGVLQQLGIGPHRRLEQDLELHTGVMSYGGNGTTISVPAKRITTTPMNGKPAAGHPDFSKMSTAQKVAYQLTKLRA